MSTMQARAGDIRRQGDEQLPRQAILLAGGLGTRLGTIADGRPKPLLPVQGVPLITRLIRQLREAGVDRCTIATCHLAEVVEAALGDGRELGMRIDYIREQEPLGTAGCLSLFKRPASSFYLLNADLVTDLPFRSLARRHLSSDAAATLAVCSHTTRLEYGVVEFDTSGRIMNYREKPVLQSFVAMGIACLAPRVCEHVSPGEAISLPELLIRLMDSGETVSSHLHDGLWCDVGRPEDYERAQRMLLRPA